MRESESEGEIEFGVRMKEALCKYKGYMTF